jgi:hypothetical protein
VFLFLLQIILLLVVEEVEQVDQDLILLELLLIILQVDLVVTELMLLQHLEQHHNHSMDQLQEFMQEEEVEDLMDLQFQVHHFSFQVEQEDQEVVEVEEEVVHQIQEQVKQVQPILVVVGAEEEILQHQAEDQVVDQVVVVLY